jgi:hypothetical protein
MAPFNPSGEKQIALWPRRPVIISAIICGLMAIAGLVLALYTYFATPASSGIPVYLGSRVVRLESKEVHLFVFPIFQFFMFFMIALPACRWRSFIKNAAERQRYWDSQTDFFHGMNYSVLHRIFYIGPIIFATGLLIANIFRCSHLLSQ